MMVDIEDGKLPLQADEAPTMLSRICHSNNGMIALATNKINPRVARRMGMKLRCIMFERPLMKWANGSRYPLVGGRTKPTKRKNALA
jgi:hypothetical protein